MSEKSYPQSSDYITVSVKRIHHSEIKSYLDQEGMGGDIGKFYDTAAMDRLYKLKTRSTPFDLISTETFLKAGWEKSGSSTYKRGDSIAMFTGIHWFCDGVQLTKDNWYEKIGDRKKAAINSKLPEKKNR